MSESSASSGGIGLVGALQIIFVIAKLFHLVTWSWWIVFLPLIISWSLLFGFLGLVLLLGLIAAVIK